MELAPGVHRVDGVVGCNAYLLVGDELTLVDTGLAGNGGAVLKYIRRLGRTPKELTRIVFTHGHPDHTGSAIALRRRTEARVLVHAGDVLRNKAGHAWVHYSSQPFSFRWDVPLFQQVPADELLEEEMLIPALGGLRVIHTPGHTAGSISLYLEDRRILFTGDTLLSDGKTCIRPLPLPGYDSDLYRQSLARLAELDFETLCGGHGSPLRGGASQALRQALESGNLDSYWENLTYRFRVTLGGKGLR